jgi:large subunit ribosomal protein L25
VATELEIECLAEKLPEFLTVDLGGLSKGQSLHVNDLKLDAGIKVVLHGRKNPVIAAVVAQEVEVVAEPVAAAPAAPAKKAAKKK